MKRLKNKWKILISIVVIIAVVIAGLIITYNTNLIDRIVNYQDSSVEQSSEDDTVPLCEFTVNHILQHEDGTEELYLSEVKNAKYNSTIRLSDLKIEISGYEYNEEKTLNTVIINDESVMVKIFYSKLTSVTQSGLRKF